ncbi:hypothetical protein DVH24_004462 [Malus domestica]|uniref:Uncharacterized protein n=1 Tax=Malus domestica TaxID=3750 RepID=A0A498I9X6_MALDO|nr:hypothetical protein DVH24_004462 [Malus domestica]
MMVHKPLAHPYKKSIQNTSPSLVLLALRQLWLYYHKHIVIGGTELFKSCDCDNMSIKDTKAHMNEIRLQMLEKLVQRFREVLKFEMVILT